jgi:hypothetical protein
MSETTLRYTLSSSAEEQAIEENKRGIHRPTGWKKEYYNYWESLPENIREYILERDGLLYEMTGISDIMRG